MARSSRWCSDFRVAAAHGETGASFWLAASYWPSPGYREHSGNLLFLLPLPPSLCSLCLAHCHSAIQTKIQKLINRFKKKRGKWSGARNRRRNTQWMGAKLGRNQAPSSPSTGLHQRWIRRVGWQATTMAQFVRNLSEKVPVPVSAVWLPQSLEWPHFSTMPRLSWFLQPVLRSLQRFKAWKKNSPQCSEW